jgi:hypothetical protein
MYSTATPLLTSCRTRANSRAMAARSRAAVGSSSSRHRVPAASARAISTICRCSTLRFAQGWLTSRRKPQSAMICRACSRIRPQSTRPARPGWWPRKTFSATVSPGTTIECWNTVAMRLRHSPGAPSGGAGLPSNRTCPASAG